MGVNIAAQLCLIPVYLLRWDENVYGAWLAVQSVFVLLQILDIGHSRFLSNEFLRIGTRRRTLVRRTLWSGVIVGVGLGGLQTLGLTCLFFGGQLNQLLVTLLNFQDDVARQIAPLLLLYSVSWWLTGSIGGILVTAVSPFGHYPKMAWWGVLSGATTATAPAIAVISGGDVYAAGCAQIGATLLLNVPLYLHLFRILSAEKLMPIRPSYKLMVRNSSKSLAMIAQNGLEMLRQQGVRILLAPLAGTAAVAGFATMRTGANVALQGMRTISTPILPELMRFIVQRDRQRVHAMITSTWAILVTVLLPGACICQLAAERLFDWWTLGKISFDPILFALLTSTVIIYAASDPAIAIINGNNLLRTQLAIATCSICVLIGSMSMLVPWIGLRGMGVALVLSEAIAGASYLSCANRWLRHHQLGWPLGSFKLVAFGSIFVCVGLIAIAAAPTFRYLTTLALLAFCIVLAALYWRTVPVIAQQRIVTIAQRTLRFRRGIYQSALLANEQSYRTEPARTRPENLAVLTKHQHPGVKDG